MCGGVAEYLDTDSTIVRLIWVLAVLFPGTLIPAFVGYFLAWIIVPRAPLPVMAAQAAPTAVPRSRRRGSRGFLARRMFQFGNGSV